MHYEDFNLICIKDKDSNKWTVYPSKFPSLSVQVEKLDEAPKKIAKQFEFILKLDLFRQYFIIIKELEK